MKLIIAGLIAGLSMTLAVSSAQAITASVVTNPNLASLAPTSLNIGDGSWFGLPPNVEDGSVVNVYRSPYDDETTDYFAIGANPDTTPSSVELRYATTKSVFSFLWGSPDAWNNISFYNGATPVGTIFTLLNLAGKSVGTSGTGAVLVTLYDFAFTRVQFSSTTQALEMGNISAVPLPAGVALLGGGVALLGLLGWRRKSKSVAV